MRRRRPTLDDALELPRAARRRSPRRPEARRRRGARSPPPSGGTGSRSARSSRPPGRTRSGGSPHEAPRLTRAICVSARPLRRLERPLAAARSSAPRPPRLAADDAAAAAAAAARRGAGVPLAPPRARHRPLVAAAHAARRAVLAWTVNDPGRGRAARAVSASTRSSPTIPGWRSHVLATLNHGVNRGLSSRLAAAALGSLWRRASRLRGSRA